MDIKTLLLKGLSTTKIVSGCQRLYIGKLCYIIKYQLKGKHLKIVQIKRKRRKSKQQNYGERMTRRQRIMNTIKHLIKVNRRKTLAFRNLLPEAGDITSIPNLKLKPSREVQTILSEIITKTKSAATITDKTPMKSSAQQTIASVKYKLSGSMMKPVTIVPPLLAPPSIPSSKATQTYNETITTGIQCKFRTISGGIQTDEVNVQSSYTQMNDDFIIESNVEAKKNNNSLTYAPKTKVTDQNAIVYMLNEIGELVLNQNDILRNNAKMLVHISDKSVLKKMIKNSQAWRKRTLERPSHKVKALKNIRYNSVHALGTVRVTDTQERSTQTDKPIEIGTFSQFSQTAEYFIKSSKLSFLKKSKMP